MSILSSLKKSPAFTSFSPRFAFVAAGRRGKCVVETSYVEAE
jgi:hypothetical protein